MLSSEKSQYLYKNYSNIGFIFFLFQNIEISVKEIIEKMYNDAIY